jgi:hypothetical protein
VLSNTSHTIANEEAVFTLCSQWLNVLLSKPFGDDTNFDSITVNAHFKTSYTWELTYYLILPNMFRKIIGEDFNSKLDSGTMHNLQNNLQSTSTAVIQTISELLLLAFVTTDSGELTLEKAFENASQENVKKNLSSCLENILTWLLLSTPPEPGPLQRYYKKIEERCKGILLIAFDWPETNLLDTVTRLYSSIITELKEMCKLGKISSYIAYQK